MPLKIFEQISYNGFNSLTGEYDGKPFRICRHYECGKIWFNEDLKGNLSKKELDNIFAKIDKLRREYKLM